MENSAQTQLYDLLVTKDFDPELKDAMGKDVNDPAEADMFTFDWKTPNKNYGTVVILIGEDRNLKIFFGDNLGRTMEAADKSDWYEFLNQLKQFSVRNNLMNFEIENINRLKYTMQGMAAKRPTTFTPNTTPSPRTPGPICYEHQPTTTPTDLTQHSPNNKQQPRTHTN